MSATERTASAMQGHNTLNAPDTNNATWFDYNENTDGCWDSPSDWYKTNRYHYYQHLAEINRGRKRGGNYWNDPYHTYQANRDLINTVARQLDLLPRQRQKAKAWFTSFDLDKWGMRADLIATCLCIRVVHEDDTDERRTHPSVPVDNRPIEFTGIPQRFQLPEKDVISMYGKIDTYLRHNNMPTTREFDQRRADERHPTEQVTPSDNK